jgi:hypothetical protein
MKSFGIVTKLLKLLSADNVRYLDTLLTAMVIKEGSPIYSPLWQWFESKYSSDPKARERAWRALSRLRAIVREYRDQRMI